MRMLAVFLATAMAFASVLHADEAEPVTLPSGLETHLQEMLWDRPGGGLVYRFRFVSSEFSTDLVDVDVLSVDLEHLCNEYALPKLSNVGPMPSRVVISLADKESEFGIYDPEVTQVFESYVIENETCIWEAF